MDNPTRTATSPPEAPSSNDPWTILARGAGTWTGRERMPSASPSPDGLESKARLSARTVLGGRGLASDYAQEVNGVVTLTSHTLLWWDQAAGRFVMHFASGAGGETTVLTGRQDQERLVFEGEGATGRMRQTFDFGGGRMRAMAEGLDPETGTWIVVFEGDYDRVDAAADLESESDAPDAGSALGTVAWRDLTVEDAPRIRDFYRAVVGWSAREVSMGDYADYNMVAGDETPIAGVCHARGGNRDLPPVWLIYVVVEDIEASVRAAEAGGGAVVSPIRSMGGGRMAVVRDPAGAALALWETSATGAG
jgi:predicted enzyme related to lactoylglutathione lyase